MSSIYGTFRQYSPEVVAQKMKQLERRGNVESLDTQSGELSSVLDGTFYNQSNDVLLDLYRKHGVGCLKFLNGDFAFVIFDPTKGQVFGAVDRIGSKPLYYSTEQGFEFSSYLFPLCIGNSYTVDSYARQCYFALQYEPAPYSMVKEVRKLGAAQYFIYDIANGQLCIEDYWDLYDNTQEFKVPSTFSEAVSVSDNLIAESVQMRMQGQKTYALFLSGGIDSSLMSAYARRYADCKAYSVSFNETSWDESSYSSQVAKHLGLKYEQLLFTAVDALSILTDLQHYYDEPMGDASALPTSFLCQQVGEQASRAICGDGGDEVFWGYPRYLRYDKRQWAFGIPLFLRAAMAGLMDVCGKKREALSLKLKDVQTLYLNKRQFNPAEQFNALTIQQSIAQCKYLYGNKEVKRAFNDFDIKSVLPYELCVKMDRAAARGHIAVQAPLLDYRLVEYSKILPTDILYQPEMGQKSILRQILYRDVPKQLFERRKRGFGVPINAWFREGLKDYIIDTINPDTAKLLPEYDSSKLIQMRDDHLSGTADYAPFLWMVANYVAWHRVFTNFGGR